MATKNWTADDIPSQQGKTILITGANSGLGLEASKVLSSKGAHVIMTARNLKSGNEAISLIKKKNSDAKLDLMQLDLHNNKKQINSTRTGPCFLPAKSKKGKAECNLFLKSANH